MAPEQLALRRFSSASDAFALGCLAYEVHRRAAQARQDPSASPPVTGHPAQPPPPLQLLTGIRSAACFNGLSFLTH
jgi:hypothetical protein